MFPKTKLHIILNIGLSLGRNNIAFHVLLEGKTKSPVLINLSAQTYCIDIGLNIPGYAYGTDTNVDLPKQLLVTETSVNLPEQAHDTDT